MPDLVHAEIAAADAAVASATQTEVTATPFGALAPPPLLHRATIGRYVALSLLGMGGMGTVYAAYDPDLERKVALKLVRSHASRTDGARLLREARALARLSHPNVVSVHDVGAVDGSDGAEVFIAMEFVEGVTVARWLGQRPRSTREILDVFLAAARGLSAAHAAGLVHRDLKPDNMMVGDDGRTRVMDFGLARAARAPAPEFRPDDSQTRGDGGPIDARLTRDGALLGTPPYMAAEQWHGGDVDARTDQFALCVSLWEALYDRRPFTGKTIHALMTAITRGAIDPPPRGGRRVPAWLRRALERGLSVAPEQRFPTMDALLAELERGQARQRRGVVLLGLGLAGSLAAAVLVGRSQRIAACAAEGAAIDDVWNDRARGELRDALVATRVSYAGTTVDKVVPRIDAWAAEWSALRAETCRETEIEGTRSPELHALTTACLDEQRDALAGLLDVLRGSQPTDVQRVVPAVAGLTRLHTCAERSSLERRPPPPEDPDVRRHVMSLRRDLMKAQGLLGAGRYAEGLEAAESLTTAAEALGYRPLAIEALALVGKLAARHEATGRAEEALRRVYLEAGGMGADELAAEAAVELVSTVGKAKNRPAEGLQWGLSAEMLITRLGHAQDLLAASLANARAQVYGHGGAYREALRHIERALQIRERILGPAHPDVAATLNVLGSLQRVTFALPEARASHERALRIREAALGRDHPDVATTLNNLGLVHRTHGDYARAQALLGRALAIRETAFGPEHLDVATTLDNLGVVLQQRGDLPAAQARLERALAIHEKHASDRASLATLLADLGHLYMARGDYARAREHFDRALALRRVQFDADHPQLAAVREGLGQLEQSLGNYDLALRLHEQVLELRRRRPDPPLPEIARALLHVAQVRGLRGESDEALRLARQALAQFESAIDPGHPEAAYYLDTLAELQRTRDPAAAERLAERALLLTQRTRGPLHPLAATSHRLLGGLARDRGDLARARIHLDKARAIAEGSLGPRALEVADVLLELAALARDRGHTLDAAEHLRRAVAIREHAGAAAPLVAAARAALAALR